MRRRQIGHGKGPNLVLAGGMSTTLTLHPLERNWVTPDVPRRSAATG